MKCQQNLEQCGFTLAEMAIVLVIASILVTAGVKVMMAQLDNAAYSATRTKQEAIRQALITYLERNRRLPCPDTRAGTGAGALQFTIAAPPDGTSNVNGAGACAAPLGVLPYATLGLSRDAALDGWQNYFSYQLSTAPVNWAQVLPLVPNQPFPTGNVGALIVNRRDTAGAVVETTSLPFSRAVVVVISHGRNGSGAYTIKGSQNALPVAATNVDERDNTNALNPNVFFMREYSDVTTAAGGAFDDSLMYMTADELLSPLMRGGAFQTPNAILLQRQNEITNAVVGFMMGVGCQTPSAAVLATLVPTLLDPWGSNMVYTSNYSAPPAGTQLTASNATLNPAGTAASAAFTLTSWGPDRTAGGGDNIVTNISIGELRGRLGAAYAARCP